MTILFTLINQLRHIYFFVVVVVVERIPRFPSQTEIATMAKPKKEFKNSQARSSRAHRQKKKKYIFALERHHQEMSATAIESCANAAKCKRAWNKVMDHIRLGTITTKDGIEATSRMNTLVASMTVTHEQWQKTVETYDGEIIKLKARKRRSRGDDDEDDEDDDDGGGGEGEETLVVAAQTRLTYVPFAIPSPAMRPRRHEEPEAFELDLSPPAAVATSLASSYDPVLAFMGVE